MTDRHGHDAGADLSARLRDLQMRETSDMLLDERDPVDEENEVTLINQDDALDEEKEPLANDCQLESIQARSSWRVMILIRLQTKP